MSRKRIGEGGRSNMNIALCYDSLLPYRGGCETYIVALARRLAADGHDVHLYARRWDASALPPGLHIHRISVPRVPRFLRPWFFGAACRRALAAADHHVSVGFDKIAGLDVLYPQGGLYAATADYNLLKHRSPLARRLARLFKLVDPAHRSFLALDRHQYQRESVLVVAISDMVRRHFEEYYHLDSANLRMVRIAIDLDRFDECDRPRRRLEARQQWGLAPEHTVALFAGMNYRLKGLEPLLRAVALLPAGSSFRLLVAGSPDTAAFERLARRLKIADRVRFAGYCPDMRNGYFAADFFVHPTFYDPCSLVVLEGWRAACRSSRRATTAPPRSCGRRARGSSSTTRTIMISWPARSNICSTRRGGRPAPRRRGVRRRNGRSSITIGKCWPSSPRPPPASTRPDAGGPIAWTGSCPWGITG